LADDQRWNIHFSWISMKYQTDLLKRIVYWFCRLSLGVILLEAGVGKGLDLPGFIGVMKTYELGLPEGRAGSAAQQSRCWNWDLARGFFPAGGCASRPCSQA
jgi:hypothetical protein